MDDQTSLQLGSSPKPIPETQRWGAPFDPSNSRPLKISRGKIDLFMECPRCAYLDLRLGIKRPKTPTFTLNNAVDSLLKREFDVHRAKGVAHPLMSTYKIDAIPFEHTKLDDWRENFKGVEYFHQAENLVITGAVDDIWKFPDGELVVVDYKATSKAIPPTKEEDLYASYKRQMEIYQWLLRRNGFKVSNSGYFVYCNGIADAEAFDGKLEFSIALIEYKGNDSWVEPAVKELKQVISSDSVPAAGKAFDGGPCDYCLYAKNRAKYE